MIQPRPIIFIVGLMLCTIAAAMILPAVVDVADGHEDWKIFFGAAVITFFVGGLMVLVAYDDKPIRLGIKEGFLLTTISWLAVTIAAAMPFKLLGLSFADAFFEAMSGITTTGATVLVGLDKLPRGVLFWRALLQGLGGLGIIVMAILILPFLRVGGMQLFQTENSDRSEKIMPRASELTMSITGVYLSMFVGCAVLYIILGMSVFDAVCHALSTVSTAGFSTHDESFGFFRSPALEWVCVIFMILGALPFVVYIKTLHGDRMAIWRDSQVQGFLSLITVVALMLAVWLVVTREVAPGEAVRVATFSVVSIVTTTGFAVEDYTAWGPFSVGLFFLLKFVGGCSGSTTGGIKIYRLQVAGMLSHSHFLHLMSPNRVVTLMYNGRRLPADVPFSVVAFLAIYLATVGIFTVILAALDLDLVTALTAATQAVGNVGPGLGHIIGPSGNYSTIPSEAKWVLSFAMLLGRLELFTVLVLFRVEFWRS
ncbi:MAG TPA: TrkH family potassium uptake protein [Caldilineaceae bacterium]|nr:TrkH family potassium uptake protein [Caldilineaceae bacterium]